MANIKQLATPKYSLNDYVNDIPAAAQLGMDMYVPAKIAANAFAKPTIGNIDVGGPSPGEAFKQIESYSATPNGGGVTAKILAGNKSIQFGHGGRHLVGTGLSTDQVNHAIADKVAKYAPNVGQFIRGSIKIDGIIIEYGAFGVKEGVMHVGTYFIIK